MKWPFFKYCIILISLFTGGVKLSAQNKPSPPILDYVTVDTATNDVILFWTKSMAPNLNRYNVYRMAKGANPYEEGDSIGFVTSSVNTFKDSITDLASKQSVHYSIGAVNNTGFASALSSTHGTIFTTVKYDSCQSTLKIVWNKYLGWGDTLISGYKLHARWDNTETIIGMGIIDSSYTFYRVKENTHYSFFVEGIKSGDSVVSLSNIARKFTEMPLPPDNFLLDYVSVANNYTVDLKFSFEPSLISSFEILRKNMEGSEFIRIKSYTGITASPVIIQDSIFTSVNTFFYKIAALNSCGNVISTSNQGTSVLLTGRDSTINKRQSIIIAWNRYKDFPLGTDSYSIYRIGPDADTLLIATNPVSDTSYTDDLAGIRGQNFSGKISYLIKAVENGSNSAYSNICNILVNTEIWMPNAFTPNSDSKNDVLLPKLSFIPEDYLMIIYDRAGLAVFSSDKTDIGWDGMINGKQMAPEGVYIYHIQYSSFNGQKHTKTGSVSVFYP